MFSPPASPRQLQVRDERLRGNADALACVEAAASRSCGGSGRVPPVAEDDYILANVPRHGIGDMEPR
ncbi:unnamed protein product [Closterium sp. NIES-54]